MAEPRRAAADMPPDLRAVDGRVPGERGQATRRRLLETTAAMLRSGGFRDLAVVDIAREAGVSAATFYQYFPDVETAIFVMADHIADDGSRRLAALVEAIDFDDPYPGAQALAAGILDLWREYEPILRVLDHGAAERDERFRQRRTQMLAAPTEALRDAVAAQQRSGRLSAGVNPAASGAVLIAMLSHVAAHLDGLRDWGVERRDLVDSMAGIIAYALGAPD